MRGSRVREQRMQRLVAALVACALVAAVVLRPLPARADTAEAFMYAGIGLGVYITIIVVATMIIYNEAPDTSAIPMHHLERDDRPGPVVHTGTACMHRDGQVTLLCW